MVRTIVQLTEEQARELKRTARERGVSVAALVRDAVDRSLMGERGGRAERVKRVRALAGSMSSGLGDLAANHDEYLAARAARPHDER